MSEHQPSSHGASHRVTQGGALESKIGVFAVTGEYWTFSFEGTTVSIKDAKGLRYLQRLLQYPGKDFHVFELLNDGAETPNNQVASSVRDDPNLTVRNLGDAGETLDSQAVKAYKQKLSDLREELEDARDLGQAERADELQSEIDFITREITRGLGLGGRHRRAGSATERARLNVGRAISSSRAKIAELHPALGDYLRRCVSTGTFCVYSPDPHQPVTWRFSQETEAPLTAVVPRRVLVDEPTLAATSEGTAFVGRVAERDWIRGRLEQARLGTGRVVLIGGAAGVGKTRLAAEVAAEASRLGFLILSGGCYDREPPEPFSPFVEMLETALARASDLKAFREYLGADAGEAARLLPQLRRIYPDLPEPLELPAEQSRRVLFNAISALISKSARNRPVLMLLDDLHWADEGTLLLMGHLAQSIANLPMLMLGTHRDHAVNVAGALAKAIEELIRRKVVDRIKLKGLPEAGVAQMLSSLGGQEVPDSAVHVIYTATEGNPFFVEELFRYFSEQGKLSDENGSALIGELEEIDAPPSVRLVMERRLARLMDQTRDVLNAAAIVGRSFTFELLQAVTRIDSDQLLKCLEEAEAAGLIVSAVRYPDSVFQFCHALARQAVIGTLSPARQQRMHLRAGEAIELMYAGTVQEHAEEIAYHLWKAGSAANKEKTFQFLVAAGKRSRSQGAFESAFVHLSNALELLKQGPETRERDQAELDLYFEYLPVLGLSSLWNTTAAGLAHSRARELCTRLGQTSKMHGLLLGAATFHLGRSEWPLVDQYARKLLELSQSAERPDWAAAGNYLLGHALCCMGELDAAHRHLELAEKLLDTLSSSQNSFAGAYARGVHGMVLWILGYPDQAKSKCNEAITIARRTRDAFLPFDLANAHIVLLFCREYSDALAAADEALSIVKFGFVRTTMGWSRNACRILAGMDRDVTFARRDFDKQFAAESRMYKARCCAVLAECYGQAGNPELGLPFADEAISLAQEMGDRMGEPDSWRVKGDLLLQLGVGRGDPDAGNKDAEACYRKGIAMARLQNARSWELRAALSLCRLLLRQQRKSEAREMLSELYGRFTEGFGTPDLIEAAALIESLSSSKIRD